MPRLFAALIALMLVAGACGSVDTGDDAATSVTTTDSVAPTDSGDSADPTNPVDPTNPMDPGDRFVSADGFFAMEVDPSWTYDGTTGGFDTWFLDPGSEKFRRNVNVFSNPTPASDLGDYIDQNIPELESALEDFVLLDSGVVSGSEGQDLALLEFTGAQQGFALTFFQVAHIANGRVAIATFTSTTDGYDEFAAAVRERLLTLEVIA